MSEGLDFHEDHKVIHRPKETAQSGFFNAKT